MTKPTKSTAVRAPALAPLVYWLVLISGLSLLTALRIGELDKTVPLWAGAVFGTGLGQILARFRLRLWLAVFVFVNLLWMLPLLALPLLLGFSRGELHSEIALMAFVPAALSGYFSLSERGALLAFWFPAAVWMISILEGDAGGRVRDAGTTGLLLGVLAVALVGWLLARESRRVALWQGTRRTGSRARGTVLLREAPLRRATRGAWVAALAVGAFAVTGWVAPHLWQKEKLDGNTKTPPSTAAGGQGSGGGVGPLPSQPCCSEASAPAPRTQVSEYLPFLHPHPEATYTPASCVACRDGVPIHVGSGGSTAGGAVTTAGGDAAGQHVAANAPPGVPTPYNPYASPALTNPHAHPTPKPPQAYPAPKPADPAPRVTPPPVVAAPVYVDPPPIPKAAPPAALPPQVPPVKATVSVDPPAVVVVETVEISPIAWLFTLALAATALQLTTRPLRRLLVLRHLGRPLWAETVDQRVSNLWQLALIGLRDAGWVAAPGEQPGELARRVGLRGMDACALVLERARHGVRIDAGDLASMERAAAEAYRAARGRIGWAARAVSWLRWPLA